jgi:hypothetical protein
VTRNGPPEVLQVVENDLRASTAGQARIKVLLLQEGKIKPVIGKSFSILETVRANELLESGSVIGNVVLVAPEVT